MSSGDSATSGSRPRWRGGVCLLQNQPGAEPRDRLDRIGLAVHAGELAPDARSEFIPVIGAYLDSLDFSGQAEATRSTLHGSRDGTEKRAASTSPARGADTRAAAAERYRDAVALLRPVEAAAPPLIRLRLDPEPRRARSNLVSDVSLATGPARASVTRAKNCSS